MLQNIGATCPGTGVLASCHPASKSLDIQFCVHGCVPLMVKDTGVEDSNAATTAERRRRIREHVRFVLRKFAEVKDAKG